MTLSLFFTLYSVFRSDAVQTFLARMGADYLSGKLGADITIRGFNLSASDGLLIEDICVLDHKRDTLFSAASLGVMPGTVSLGERNLAIRKVSLGKGLVQLLIHRGDSVLNLQRMIDNLSSSPEETPADTVPSRPWKLKVDRVSLSGTRFHMQDMNEETAVGGMDYTHLDARGIDLEIVDMEIDHDTITATILRLNAAERCGLNLREFSGKFSVSPRFLKAGDLVIRTDRTKLSLSFDFLYDNWRAYNDFLNKVTIRAKINPSTLDFRDIGFFAPELATMSDCVTVSGIVRGTVSNFKAKDLDVRYGQGTVFQGNVSALGLPDVEETFIDMNIREFTSSMDDLATFVLPGSSGTLSLPDWIGNAGPVTLKGYFTGFYNDFVANARLKTQLGELAGDLSLKRQKNSDRLAYQGSLSTTSLNIGRLTGSELIGPVTFKAEIDGQGLTLDEADLKIKMKVDSLFLNRYNYSGLAVEGALSARRFNGMMQVRDPNLGLDFQGVVDLSDSLPDFDFSSLIRHADLRELHLTDSDSLLKLKTLLSANFKGNDPDNIDGAVRVSDLVLDMGSKRLTMDRLALLTRQDTSTGKSYHLQSDFADADLTGRFSFRGLVPSLTAFIKNYLASFNLNDSLRVAGPALSGQKLVFEVRFRNSDELTHLFLPFLRISEGSVLTGSYDEDRGSIILLGNAPSLYVNNMQIQDWTLLAENTSENLMVKTGAKHVYLKKAEPDDSLEMRVDTVQLVSNLRRDSVIYQLGWNAKNRPSKTGGFLFFRNDGLVELKLTEVNAFINARYWTVDTANQLLIGKKNFSFSHLGFRSGDQLLTLSGVLSESTSDTLTLGFSKVDVSEADQLIGTSDVNLDGIVSGRVKLTDPYGGMRLYSDIRINKLRFNGESLGDASVRIDYNADASRFDVLSKIFYTGNTATSIPFSLSGFFLLDKNIPRFNFDLELANLNLKMFGPFVSDFMSGLGGLASGKVSVRGTPDHPDISGRLSFLRAGFKINYLNVPYSFADVVDVDSNAFIFNKITLYDSIGNKALLNGRITHHHFTDLRLDLNLEMNDFSAFNNTRAQNSIFYGKARASGTASITGPPEDIRITVKATNGGNTHVAIPIDLTQSVGQADYIIFEDPDSDSLGAITAKPPVNTTGLSLDLGLRVNQEAEVEVFFPEQLGNLKASGTGNLLMNMTPVTPFYMSGIYTLSKGYFLFQFKNLLRLPMTIREGSTISWTGDATDANISISAVYKTKAPLKGLTTNTEQESIRVPVECIIRLGGKLMNPDISFAINLPNAEEGIKTAVFAAIDTNNPAAITEQTIYLMVMNQFKPVVTTAATGVDVGATSISLVTNQINSMISQIASNVNFNMNYKPATSTAHQEFDVGISTQLFNDRLLIDGTFGMNSGSNTSLSQSSTIVGDINVEYVLTKNRRWRARAFNRTNTLNILNNNAPYTQGVGIKYQRDFSTLKDLFNLSTPGNK